MIGDCFSGTFFLTPICFAEPKSPHLPAEKVKHETGSGFLFSSTSIRSPIADVAVASEKRTIISDRFSFHENRFPIYRARRRHK